MRKIDYYNTAGKLLKTLSSADYQLHQDKFWRAGTRKMVNHITGKSTDLLELDLRFDLGFDDNDFSQHTLKRVR